MSDASNLLDAQVVLADGTALWASTQPDLMWALRGTEGGFGIVTRFKFSVKPFPENGKIWGGPILVPRGSIGVVAKGIAAMCQREDVHPKVGLFLYVMRKELMAFVEGGRSGEDMLVVHAYDGLGEEHGRRDFKWALDIEGAVDLTKRGMTMRDVTNMQGKHLHSSPHQPGSPGKKHTIGQVANPGPHRINRRPEGHLRHVLDANGALDHHRSGRHARL